MAELYHGLVFVNSILTSTLSAASTKVTCLTSCSGSTGNGTYVPQLSHFLLCSLEGVYRRCFNTLGVVDANA